MKGVSALAKEIKTLGQKTLKVAGVGAGLTESTSSGPTVHKHNHSIGRGVTAAFTGSQPSRLSISGCTHRGPGTNCCSQPVVCHTDLSIPSSVVSFMFLSLNHSVVFEIAPKHTVSDSLADYDGYSISSKEFLPTVVDVMVI